MISRRRFLELSATSAGVAAFGGPKQHAESQDVPLPTSIAALKPRKDEAAPISREERQLRQARARKLMAENSLDAMVIMTGTSLQYFGGIHWWGGERMFTLVLPAQGNAFYVCPAFEEGRAREQIHNAPEGERPDVRVWQEDESPYPRLPPGSAERG